MQVVENRSSFERSLCPALITNPIVWEVFIGESRLCSIHEAPTRTRPACHAEDTALLCQECVEEVAGFARRIFGSIVKTQLENEEVERIQSTITSLR
jgi:hypothetical protein